MGAVFYVMDLDEGVQLDDSICGCINEFETYSKAFKLAKQISMNYEGRYTVDVMISSEYWENGKKYLD